MKVCLDAGHGGVDNGTSGNNILEDAWALEFVQRVGHHLRALGAETVLTRTTDTRVGIDARAQIAVKAKCDLFVSIHCNGAGNHTADGVEAFYAPAGTHVHNSEAIASELVNACVKAGMDSRGIKKDSQSQHPRLGVLRGTCRDMPAVLLEVGFVSNSKDAGRMKNAEWREALATAIAKAIVT